MKNGMAVLSSLFMLGLSASVCHAAAAVVGAPIPLGPHGLARSMERNAEIATYIARRGYPDWAELVEVDAELPLHTHEVRLYYLRLNREIAFTNASVLGRRDIALRLSEQPLDATKRAWIEQYYFNRDPARRAELAATRAVVAAERAEQAADDVFDAADKTELIARRMERDFVDRLRK